MKARLLVLLLLAAIQLSTGFLHPRFKLRCLSGHRLVVSGAVGSREWGEGYSPPSVDDELATYWAAHNAKWSKTLSHFDVRFAWSIGSLDGILPSGHRSSEAPTQRLISLPQALEMFEAEEPRIKVRRKFRDMNAEELRPRWEKVISKRAELMKGPRPAWPREVQDAEKTILLERSLVDGNILPLVEAVERPPPYAEASAWLLTPLLKVKAEQRNQADGGVKAAQVILLETAGDDPTERWLTAELLNELESELANLLPVPEDFSAFSAVEEEYDVKNEIIVAAVLTLTAGMTFMDFSSGGMSALETPVEFLKGAPVPVDLLNF